MDRWMWGQTCAHISPAPEMYIHDPKYLYMLLRPEYPKFQRCKLSRNVLFFQIFFSSLQVGTFTNLNRQPKHLGQLMGGIEEEGTFLLVPPLFSAAQPNLFPN